MWRYGVLLIVVALIAAACGGDDDESAEEASGGTTTSAADGGDDQEPAGPCDSPGVTEDSIVIGAQVSQTGIQSSIWTPTVPGMEARIAHQNEQGGVNGRTIELEIADDASDAQQATQAARELIEEKDAFAVIMAGSLDVASAPYYEEKGVPVTGWPVSASYGKHRNFFGYSGGNSPTPTPVTTGGEFLDSKGVTKLGVISYAFPASTVAGEQYVTSFETVSGNDAIFLGDAPVGNADWSVQAQQLKEAGADGLYMPIGLQDAANVYQAVVQAGVDLKAVIFPAGYGPVALEQLGSKIEGASFSIDFIPYSEELPAHEEVLTALEEHAPEAPIQDNMTDQGATVGWLSADLMIRGLEEAGDCPTREDFMENLRAVEDYDGGGLLDPPVNMEESFGRPYLTCAYFTTVQDGAFVTEEPAPLCGEVIGE